MLEMMPWDQQGCKTRMEEINQAVKDVSSQQNVKGYILKLLFCSGS